MSSGNGTVTTDERLNKAAVVIRRLKERIAHLEREEQRRAEPIAVVGMGCRFPGGADSPDAYWALLDAGRDAVQPLDARWALIGERPRQDTPCWGGMLTEPIDRFDPEFFGISPREAAAMDPQHRLLLEVAWEALEHAGIRPRALDGSATGVFIGACATDYQHIVMRQPPEAQDVYCTTGNMISVAAGRLSYTLGLQGPCLMIDTACSSSLVSIHLACRSLRAGESDLALAGGVNLLLSPIPWEAAWRLQALSADGRCRTFDAAANGFVRGEGCGLVVLKRLSDAQRDGDRIWALIRGSAVNQDGRSTGLTAPNVLSQQALLRAALASARVAPEAIGYVETHGTGTSLGDPIEVEALRAVVGAARPDGARCVLGAVKTNVGHLEGAAGVAGLMKAVLALAHERIPRNLNFRTLNPRIRLDGTALVPAAEPTPWPRGERPRFAGVSSFGLSGTNAHIVLEEAPPAAVVAPAPARAAELVALSARTDAALSAQAGRLAAHLEAHPELALGDVAFSLATTRTEMEHRLALSVASRDELRAALAAAAAGDTPARTVRARVAPAGAGKVVFVFPGQGSQWLGMCRALLSDEPVFRAVLERCEPLIQAEAGFSLLDELAADEATSRLGRIDVIQPVLFAVAVGLAELWRSWGVQPDAVVGHSMGEVAAAHVAGALSLADAVAVICRRSRLLRRLSGRGEMAMVELTVAEAEAALRGYEDRLSVAVSNSPRFTVLSGDPAALAAVLASLEARGVFSRRIKADVASHSPQMDALRDDLLAALAGLQPQAAAVAMRSTVTDAVLRGPELSASYWAANLRQPVRFAQAIQDLVDQGHALFVEMSPHPILVASVEEILGPDGRGLAVGSLRRDQPERAALLESLGALWAHGFAVDWARQFPAGGRRVPLPTYGWTDRERYWLDAGASLGRRDPNAHPLLGDKTRSSLGDHVTYWTQELSLKTTRYLEEHGVGGQVVFPAAGYLEMALQAAAEELGGAVALEGFEITEALLFGEDERRVVQLALTRDDARAARFQVASASQAEGSDGKWTVHARGRAQKLEADAAATAPLGAWQARTQAESWQAFDGETFYARLLAAGLEYGESFRGVQRGWRRPGEALAELACVGDVARTERLYGIHPGLLDAALQVIAAAMGEGDGGIYLPAGVESVRVARPRGGWAGQGGLWSYARCAPDGDETIKSDVQVCNAAGEVLAEVRGFRARKVQGTGDAGDEIARWVHEIQWEELAPGAAAQAVTAGRDWVVFADGRGALAAVADGLRAQGCRVLEVARGAGFAHDEAAGRFAIDPREDGDYDRLLQALAAAPAGAGWGILHGWSLDDALLDDALPDDAPPEGALPEGALPDGAPPEGAPPDGAAPLGDGLGWRSLVALVQALGRRGAGEAHRLVVLTRGARAVVPGDRLSGVAQTPVIGLCKTIAHEHPELGCRCVDLGEPEAGTPAAAATAADVAALLRELAADSREEELALRAGRRFAPRLVRAALPPDGDAASAPFDGDAFYLVTGGLRGIGLGVATWLARRGARHLALLGRSAPGEAARAVVDQLRAAGVEVRALQADVARADELGRALDALKAEGRPIRGVFHLAGVLDNAVLTALTPERIAAVMAPKAEGAWNLHRLTRDQPLDRFVLFSSVASIFGAPGQANHAAANAFLDGFAAFRAARGAPASSINWGAWAELGEAAEGKAAAWVQSRGLRPMAPDDALRALERAAAHGAAQAAIVAFDRNGPADVGLLDKPFFSRLVPELAGRPGRGGAVDGLTRKQLVEAAPGERQRLVTQFLRDLVAAQAGFAKARLDVHRPLTSLGLDSLMTLRLKNRIASALGASVPATLFLQGVSTAQLAAHVLGALGLDGATTAAAATPAEPSGAATRAAQRRARLTRRTGSHHGSTTADEGRRQIDD